MKKIPIKAAGILTAMLCLSAFPAFAGTGGGSETRTGGQTDVMAGVAIDYMGELRFEVKEEKTMAPIPGASIELWIPGILGGDGAYVLFGVTDQEGALELEVAYQKGQENQWIDSDGKLTFDGSTLYLPENRIQYQAYKAGWLPYPKQDEVILTWEEIPQVEIVLLHKEEGPTEESTEEGPTEERPTEERPTEERPTEDRPDEDRPDEDRPDEDRPDEERPEEERPDREKPTQPSETLFIIEETEVPEIPQIPEEELPKTGVEQYARYWGMAFLFFLAAAVTAGVILYRGKKKKP